MNLELKLSRRRLGVIWGQIIADWGRAIIRDEEYDLVLVSFSLFCHYWIFSKD